MSSNLGTILDKLNSSLNGNLPKVKDFGWRFRVSYSGNFLVVGDPDNRSAYVLTKCKDGNWELLRRITPPSINHPVDFRSFGYSVAISDTTDDGNIKIVVGTPYATVDRFTLTGIVCVFCITAEGACYLEKTFLSETCKQGEYYGMDVDISSDGTKILIGNPCKNNYNGEVENWLLKGKWVLKSTMSRYGIEDHPTPSGFGNSVSFSKDGNTVAIGSPGSDNSRGAVHLYTREEDGGLLSKQTISAVGKTPPGLKFGCIVRMSETEDARQMLDIWTSVGHHSSYTPLGDWFLMLEKVDEEHTLSQVDKDYLEHLKDQEQTLLKRLENIRKTREAILGNSR